MAATPHRVAVLGGTGTAGAAAAGELRSRGYEVVTIGRRAGGPGHRVADVATGDGLAGALAGTDVVVDCLNAMGRGARSVLVDGVRRVLDIAHSTGVAHAVSLSIVGCDRVPMGYYRVKVEQEGVVRAAALPATIVRATQFHTLLDSALRATRRTGLLPVFRGPLQPIDPVDVGRALADAIERGPGANVVVAGPEIAELADLAHAWRRARSSRRPVVRLPVVGRGLRAVAAGGLTDPDAPRGAVTWGQFLSGRSE